MTAERPYEMLHIAPKLRTDFTGIVPEATSGNDVEREKNFLTRALAAYTLHKLTECTLVEAAAAVVDGGGDGGIDAIHFSPTANILWLVQSKYIENGRGQPELGEANKFKSGIEALIQGKFDTFADNAKWQAIMPQVQTWMKIPALQIKAVLVYTGSSLLIDDRIRIFEDLQTRFNNDDNFISFTPYGLTSIDAWINGLDDGAGVEKAEIEVLHPGWFKEPYETILGRVRVKDITNLYQQHGEKIIAANIRRYKGSTVVNEKIRKTANEEPQHLFYLNNGLTAYCDRFEVPHEDRANQQKKTITAYGLSIVNGAQTLGSLAKAYPDPNTATDGYVALKIISLHGCADDREFARRITESTNFQNQISARDFASIDEQQERIAAQLRVANIEYHYKYGDDTPDSDESKFTLDDATIALACLEQDFELCARILSDRKSLWSFDPVYPETDLLRSRYERLFQPGRSARTIWRAVQTYQIVLERMRAEGRTSQGIRKAFFENCRWLVLKIVYVQLHTERGEELALAAEEKAQVTAKALEIAEALWLCCETQGLVSKKAGATTGAEQFQQARHFKSVFCDPADCKRLYDATMARIATAAQTDTTSNAAQV